MPLLIEDIIATVLWLIAVGLTITAGFVITAVQRRITRQRYFEQLDRARERALALVEPLFDGRGRLDTVFGALRSFRSKPERDALEQVLLWHTQSPEHLALTREIAQRLGWIQGWTEALRSHAQRGSVELQHVLGELRDDYRPPLGFRRLRLWVGTTFLERCRAAERLARIPTPGGLLALLAGTADSHLEVREVCVRNLGRLADPATLPVLIAELIEVLEGRSRLSVRTLKTALVQFPLEEADAFRDALQHPNRRVRFFATDIIREIADRRAAVELLGKNDFSPEIYRLFTETLWRDEWGDVRARASLVIAHFHDSLSASILQAAVEDPEWFVRLHATRAATGKLYQALAPVLARRLTDSHWLVREATVRSLRQMGDYGVEHIFRAFLTTQDRYAAEQIAEEVQRSGMLVELLANLNTEEDVRRARSVARRLVELDRTTMLQAYLSAPVPSELKLLLIHELSGAVNPACLQALRTCAEADPDPRVRTAATTAFSTATMLATGSGQN